MRISNRQIIALMAVLKDSLCIVNGMGGYNQEQLVSLYNELINQQDGTVRELGE